MTRAALSLSAAAIGLVVACASAQAGDYGPFSWLFSTDNGGPLAPAITPDRPYWHGDSAVPPAMRWHDREIEIVDEYGFTIGTRLPPPEDVVPIEVEASLPPPVRGSPPMRRHHSRTRAVRAACPPPPVRAVTPASLGVSEPPDPLYSAARRIQ